jgi:membrane fusion protein, multidrug efflux system
MKKHVLLLLLCVYACNGSSNSSKGAQAQAPPKVAVVKVIAQKLSTTDKLPAELTAYQQVAIYPRVNGFVEDIPVDRGSIVHRGQLLTRLSAPELVAQRAEVQAKVAADRDTYQRLEEAAATPGAVSDNELAVAKNSLAADIERSRSLSTLEGYLRITAPFDGIVTERDVHPGALVGPPNSSASIPVVRVEQDDRLRLTVPVPEADVGDIVEGVNAEFTVSAWPAHRFAGKIARISHAIDERTRTMPVELDVDNHDGKLAPGMFAEVVWPVNRNMPTLFVPASAVVETMEATFVDAVRDGRVRRVPVKRGRTQGDLVEAFGGLHEPDFVLVNGSEELADGTRVETDLRGSPSGSNSPALAGEQPQRH